MKTKKIIYNWDIIAKKLAHGNHIEQLTELQSSWCIKEMFCCRIKIELPSGNVSIADSDGARSIFLKNRKA